MALLPLSAQKPRVTIIPFNSIGISKSDAQGLALLFETALHNTDAFVLIEQMEAENILKAQEYSLGDCVDEQCAIEIGRLLSADQIVLGTVGRIADVYYLAVKIIDVQTGQNLISKKEQVQKLSELVGKIDTIALQLAGEQGGGSTLSKIVHLDLPEGRYEGTIKDGKRHGQGTLYFTDGSRYVGEWIDDKFNGQGTLHCSWGDQYVGEWRDHRFNGQATYYYANGDRYVGEWIDGKRHGQGTIYYVSGERYEGEWIDDKYNGQATYYFADGERYEGEWRDNYRHGQGISYYVSGERYEGEWIDGKRHGQGTYYFADGERYEGEWRDHYRHGQGTLYYVNGDRYVGEWRDDGLVGGWLYKTDGTKNWVSN